MQQYLVQTMYLGIVTKRLLKMIVPYGFLKGVVNYVVSVLN